MNRYKLFFLIIFMVLSSILSFGAISIEGSLTHELNSSPGDMHEGKILINNNGNEPEEVKIYITDFRTEAGGKKYYLDPDTTARSNASWVSVNPKRFFIPAGQTYTLYFSIDVPADSTLSGSYWSMMMIESIPKESPESSFYDPEEITLGVKTVLRYGIRIISNIDKSVSIKPEIQNAGLSNEEDIIEMYLDIKNAGNRFFRLDFWMELYDTSGNFIGKYQGDKLSVFPDSSIRFSVDLSNVPKDEYMALVVMDCGDDNVFGVNYTIDLK